MFASLDTPAVHQRKKYEFTPIGHIKEKENMIAQELRQNKRPPLEDEEDAVAEGNYMKRSRVGDDTMTSQQMFNETSFDDTLPEQTLQGISAIKKNLAPELLSNDNKEKAELASNPLKEQQHALQKLNMENYSLRVKCNSLLKFLNNVTDDGKLKQGLEMLDELQEWKTKHHELIQRFKELQLRYDELEQREPETLKVAEPANHSHCEKLRAELEASLKETRSQLEEVQATVSTLEQRLIEVKKDYSEKEHQYKMSLDIAKSENNRLSSSLSSREDALNEAQEKINRLMIQLEEFDHTSGSLLELEKKIDEKNQGIRNLETRLQELNFHRQDLERQLLTANETIGALKKEHEEYKQQNELKLSSLHKNTSGEDKLRKQLRDLEEDNEGLQNLRQTLEERNKELDERVGALESQVAALEEDRQKIVNEQQQVIRNLKLDHQKRTQNLKREIDELRELNQQLEETNRSYKKRFEHLSRNSPARKATQEELTAKDREIGALKRTIRDIEESVLRANRELETAKLQHRREKSMLEARLDQAASEEPFERSRLEKEISMLKLEIRSIQDTKERELALWESKYESLKNTYEKLLQQDKHSNLNEILEDRREELKSLMKKYNDLTTENLELNRELNKQKNHKEAYKEDLRKVQARLDFITKEFVKLKESAPEMKDSSEELNSKWMEKYQNMKTKLLNELKVLQDENIQLERKLLDISQQQGHHAETPTQSRDSSLQDKVDYYRLKYHDEVRKNNDLRVINEYLNRVLKASSQHLKLDILKLENEISPLNSSATYINDYDYNYAPSYYSRRGRPLKFKTVAIFVLSCIRMYQATLRRRWDQQRISYLQRKIAYGEDRITW
ncbi:AaceriAER241Wp [[Ashbya] aceris (nom. inval.)]|nr:AaceriAER241Wp [[Ashbya] aceris (nom. inval.)]